MKTSAFKTIVGLAVATTILAGQSASAQLKSSVASKKAASTLKTNVLTTTSPEETKKILSLSLFGTNYFMPQNENNFVETDITASFALADKVKLDFDTGFEGYWEKPSDNNGYDLEVSLNISDLEIVPNLTFATGLIAVLPTSGGAHDNNMTGGWGAKGNFATKLAGVGLGLDNQYYQYIYKSDANPTPMDKDDLEELGGSERFYTGWNTVAFSVLKAGIPLGPVTWKNDTRYRVKTPYVGEETVQVRYRTRLAYTITDFLSVMGGVYWQKKINDPKAESFFSGKNQVYVLSLGVDI